MSPAKSTTRQYSTEENLGFSLNSITPRQREVALLITSGYTNRQIGDRLGIKESVVKNYLKEIFDRLGVWTRLELSIFLADRGIYGEDQDDLIQAA